MDECLTVTLKIPISPFTLVCIRVQWNHPDLSGVCPGCEVPAGRLLRNRGCVQLSEAEEPINTLKRAEV